MKLPALPDIAASAVIGVLEATAALEDDRLGPCCDGEGLNLARFRLLGAGDEFATWISRRPGFSARPRRWRHSSQADWLSKGKLSPPSNQASCTGIPGDGAKH